MKKLILTTLFGVAMAFALNTSVQAEETTVEGTATCAKCDLGTADSCTNVLQVKEGGETVTYYLDGEAGKKWHSNICKGSKEVKVTGEVKEEDGKKTIVASSVEIK